MFKPYFELNIPTHTDNNSCLCFRCSVPLCDFKEYFESWENNEITIFMHGWI